jgi:hypothetical protein
MTYSAISERREVGRRVRQAGLPLVAASADQRGFLIIYERPGTQLNLADVYELVGMAVVG